VGQEEMGEGNFRLDRERRGGCRAAGASRAKQYEVACRASERPVTGGEGDVDDQGRERDACSAGGRK
jgi:hypothetical protein